MRTCTVWRFYNNQLPETLLGIMVAQLGAPSETPLTQLKSGTKGFKSGPQSPPTQLKGSTERYKSGPQLCPTLCRDNVCQCMLMGWILKSRNCYHIVSIRESPSNKPLPQKQ